MERQEFIVNKLKTSLSLAKEFIQQSKRDFVNLKEIICMQILHVTVTAEEGKIIIDVPETLNGKEFDITVTEKEEKPEKFQKMTHEEKMELFKQFAGSAKYPDTIIDKYEWYEQAGDY